MDSNGTTIGLPPIGLIIYKATGIGILILGNWFANTTCIIVLSRLKEMNPVTKILMFSMTGADLATGATGVFILGSVIAGEWPFGYIICRIAGVINTTLISGSMFSLLAINTERYIAVTRPFQYQSWVTKSRAHVVLVLLWLIALSTGLLSHLLPGRKTVFNPVLHSCVSDPIDPNESDILGTIWNGVFFLLPILMTLVMFLRLYLISRYHAARIAAQTVGVNNDRNTKRNMKGSTTFFLMTIAILSLSTPTLLGYFYENMTRRQVPLLFSYICVHLVFSYSIVNVGIYYVRNSAFRRMAKIVVVEVFRRSDNDEISSSIAVVSNSWQ